LVNGQPVKKRTKLQTGDEIEIEFALTPEINLLPEAIPLEILYEDDHLLAVNKPAGMVVHPAVGNWSGTFVNALLYHCKSLPVPQGTVRPGIVHRLDKETSGVLVAAKTAIAQQRLIELFAARKIHKEYLAICIGNPGKGEINAPIGRHPADRQKMAVLEANGKEAVTHYETIAWNETLSIVRLVITTGRTHQIRVHMRYKGTPVLGDPIYGVSSMNEKMKAERQLLHAGLLRFNHPITGTVLELTAKLPNDMQLFTAKIDFLHN
jgi:23S rRNA pseudouridine1911/1915/1917 synthase